MKKIEEIKSILMQYTTYLDKKEYDDDEKIKDWYRIVEYVKNIIDNDKQI